MNRKFTLVIYLMLVLGPLLAGAVYSFLYSTGSIGLLSDGFSFAAWKIVLSDKTVFKSFTSTIFIATLCILAAVSCALFIVVKWDWLHRSKFSEFLLNIPLTIPPMIAAFIMFQLLYKGGILSRLFFKMRIINESSAFPELVNDGFNTGVMLTMTLFVLPFFVVFYLQKWHSLDINTYRTLAASLGANRTQTNRRVVIPLLLKNSWLNIALYWLILFGNFEIPLLLGSQNPAAVSVLISRKLTRYDLGELPQAYVISTLYLLMVLIVFLMFVVKNRKISAS